MRKLGLSDTQSWAILSWGTEYRALLRKAREADPAAAERSHEGDTALQVRPSARFRSLPAARRAQPFQSAPSTESGQFPSRLVSVARRPAPVLPLSRFRRLPSFPPGLTRSCGSGVFRPPYRYASLGNPIPSPRQYAALCRSQFPAAADRGGGPGSEPSRPPALVLILGGPPWKGGPYLLRIANGRSFAWFRRGFEPRSIWRVT